MSRSAFRNELAAAGRLAVPVVVSQLGMMLMGTVDTMMLGHLSAGALAAGALGNVLTYCLLIFGYGILAALDPLVSQAHGAEDARAIGGHLQRGLAMAAALTVPIVLLLLDVGPFLHLLGQAPAGVARHWSALASASIVAGLVLLVAALAIPDKLAVCLPLAGLPSALLVLAALGICCVPASRAGRAVHMATRPRFQRRPGRRRAPPLR